MNTTSKELVGPLKRVRFADGSVQYADLPGNTLDPRWRACHSHHTACDCREAGRSETITELGSMLAGVEKAAAQILAGHATHAWVEDPVTGEERDVSCMCTGCQIVRAAYISTPPIWSQEYVTARGGVPR